MDKINPNIKPSAGYLLTKSLEGEKIKGVDIVDDEEFPQFAEVLAVGESKFHTGTDKVYEAPCKVGDKIIHSSAGFENIKMGAEEYRMVPFERVLGVRK